MPNSILTLIMSALSAMSTNPTTSTVAPNTVVDAGSAPTSYTCFTGMDGLETAEHMADNIFGEELSKLSNGKGDDIVNTAKQYLGARYRMGSMGPHQFDCSGFTSYVYKQEEISITRTSRSQFTEGVKIHRISDLQKGDLVFFGGRRTPRSVGHVGIVTEVDAENGVFKFIHASNRGVVIDKSTTSYYSQRYLGARRILADEQI